MRRASPLREVLNAALGLLREYKNASLDLAKIEMTIYYVQLIQSVRHICLSLCGVLFALALAVTGMVMAHVFFISLAGDNNAAKSAVLFILAAADLAVGAVVFQRLFSEERWLKHSGTEALVEKVSEEP